MSENSDMVPGMIKAEGRLPRGICIVNEARGTAAGSEGHITGHQSTGETCSRIDICFMTAGQRMLQHVQNG